MKERHVIHRRLGVYVDVEVYSTGGTAHWVEMTRVGDGKLIRKRKFVTDARRRAMNHADQEFRAAETFYLTNPGVLEKL